MTPPPNQSGLPIEFATEPVHWLRSDCTPRELRLLCYLAEREYSGKGEIFDLGCGNGGSTYCLCHGLQHNQRTNGRATPVHALDWFEIGSGKHSRHASREKFVANTADFEEQIVLLDQDIRSFRWNGAAPPIEILFVDIAKELDLFEAVVRQFYTTFVPGTSLIVHQDFGRPRLPWLHYGTMLLLPYTTILDVVDDTLVVRVDRQPDSKVLERLFSPSLSPASKAELVLEVKQRLGHLKTKGVDYRSILALSEVYVWLYAGDFQKAQERLDGFAATSAFDRAFPGTVAELRSLCERKRSHLGL